MGVSDEWVDVQELAELLHTTPKGIYKRRSMGQLPHDWSRIGTYIVWPRPTIERWLEGEGADIRRANIMHAEKRDQ